MQKIELTHEQTGYFSKIILDYLAEEKEVKEFYKYPVTINSFEKIVADKLKDNTNRKILVEVLEAQNKTYLDTLKEVASNIQLLSSEKTFTITTGHQLCVAGGPFYFIYKIIGVINLCKSLREKYPTYNFVPVFWLATEDHGEGEITKVNLFGKTIEWKHTEKGASGGRKTAPYTQVDEQLRQLLAKEEQAKEILNVFQKSYSEAFNMADATRNYLYQLFGEYGLVIIDGNDEKLKKEFVPIMKDELENFTTYNTVSETTKALAINYKTQAYVRKINLFYLGKGYRQRIEQENGIFYVKNTDKTFTKDEILQELEKKPEKFSPNVLLRPLYEEKVLPNLAYIGGPGESAYWLQLKSNFEYHNINFPMVVLRNSVQWIDFKSFNKINKLKIEMTTIFKSIVELERIYLANHSRKFTIEKENLQINKLYDSLSFVIQSIDKSLIGNVEGERVKHLKGLQNIATKTNRAIKQKHEIELNQLRKIKRKLFPNEGLQERYENFIPYYVKYGKSLFSTLFENLDVLNKKFTVLIEN